MSEILPTCQELRKEFQTQFERNSTEVALTNTAIQTHCLMDGTGITNKLAIAAILYAIVLGKDRPTIQSLVANAEEVLTTELQKQNLVATISIDNIDKFNAAAQIADKTHAVLTQKQEWIHILTQLANQILSSNIPPNGSTPSAANIDAPYTGPELKQAA